MTHCPHCGQAAHSNILECPAVAYALDDRFEFSDLVSANASEVSKRNARSAKKRRKWRGKIGQFVKRSADYKS